MDVERGEFENGGGRLAVAATAAGAMWVAEWLVGLGDPIYYAPTSPLDYVAAVTFTVALVTTSVALVVVWHQVAPRRASLFVGLAAVAATVAGLGNLFEDVFGVATGDLFFYGGSAMFASLALGGLAALTAPPPERWVGIVLILSAAGIGFELGALLMISWFGCAIAARRGVFSPPPPLTAASRHTSITRP